MTPTAVCPACADSRLETFHHQHAVPSNSCLLLTDRTEAHEYPTGELDIYRCVGCGFIGNRRFDAGLAEYSARYEETQIYSPRFVDFARSLAKQWVETYDLHDRSVLEIGCGKGEFLVMMCEAGVGRATGIDPGTHPERIDSPVGERIEWITDFYSERYAHLDADAIVCRHTLEHIQPVGEFMRMLRRAIGDRTDTVVLFELPDVLRVLEETAFWDIYYEHCSYFTVGSLARLFRSTGFDVLDVSLVYDDQYILIEARPSSPGAPATAGPMSPMEDDLARIERAAAEFRDGFEAVAGHWGTVLGETQAAGRRAVIWGAGSKGVAFLCGLGEAAATIEYAVDINPHKHGMYMAGTGQEIVPPEFLPGYRPDLVIAMNPVYVDEIERSLRELGLSPQVVAV